MLLEGKKIKIPQWIHSDLCAVHLEVEAVIPDADPSEPCLEPPTLKFLDQLQRLADIGDIAQLEKHGTVYVKQTA